MEGGYCRLFGVGVNVERREIQGTLSRWHCRLAPLGDANLLTMARPTKIIQGVKKHFPFRPAASAKICVALDTDIMDIWFFNWPYYKKNSRDANAMLSERLYLKIV